MKSQLSAVLIDTDKSAQDSIQQVLHGFGASILVAAANDLQQGMRIIQSGTPNIVILNVEEVERGVRETASIVSRFPNTSVFVTASEKNPDWILKLIRAGANEYLTKPIAADELIEAIKKVSLLHLPAKGAQGESGKVITVYNPTGGLGTTTIAVNLAVLLALQGKSTALIDLDLCCGDVAEFLDLEPRYTLASLPAKRGELDANFVRSVVMQHPTGIQVLSSPYDVEEAGRIQPELVQDVLVLFRSMYDYTIIDTGGPLYGCNHPLFCSSDELVFNTILTVPALRNAKRYLAALSRTRPGDSSVRLVVNRYTQKEEIKLADLEKVLNLKTFHTVPNAYAEAKASINKGVPLVTEYPKSPVRKALDELAQKLVASPAAASLHRF